MKKIIIIGVIALFIIVGFQPAFAVEPKLSNDSKIENTHSEVYTDINENESSKGKIKGTMIIVDRSEWPWTAYNYNGVVQALHLPFVPNAILFFFIASGYDLFLPILRIFFSDEFLEKVMMSISERLVGYETHTYGYGDFEFDNVYPGFYIVCAKALPSWAEPHPNTYFSMLTHVVAGQTTMKDIRYYCKE